MASVNNLAWLEDDDKPSTTSQQPSASPAKALPEPAVKQPNWFDDDAGTDDTKRTSRRPAKGGEEVSIDAPVAPTRSAPPTAFLERMRAFEQQRQQTQQGTASPTGPTPPKLPAPPADGASRPSPRVARQKQVSSVSPSGSPDAATPSSSRTTPQTRPSESPSVIGTDVGLSDASATKPVSLDEFAPLTDEERQQHRDEIAVWGEDTVARARAPSFQLRTAAIEHIATVFEDKYTSMTNKALNAAFDTIGRLISDSVPKVAVAACGVLESIVAQAFFIQDESIPRLALGLDAACARLKDTNSKVREAAAQLLLQLARHDSIGPVTIVDSICGISRHDSHRLAATLTSLGTTLSDGSDFATTLTSAASTLMKPSQSILGNWREVVHRIELCQTFVRIYPNVCRSCQEGIMALALAGLNSSNSKVRRSAIIFAADVYKVLGPEMESYFSNVTAPATLKLLHEEIQAVCGSAGPQGGKGTDDGSADASGVVEQVLEERADVAAFEASGTVLTAEEQANVQFWRTAFDFASMMCIYSSSWKMRAKVLGRVRAALVAKTTTASSECVSAVLSQMLVIALQDSVPTVLAAAIDLTFVIVDSPLLPPNLLLSFATPLVLLVLKQVGGQQSAASRPWDTVIAMLRNGGRDAPARVASVVTRADAGALSKVVAKVVVPRVEIVSAIVDQASADLDALGVSADEVLVFAVECLRHPQSKVRSAAIELVLAVYRAAGNVVQHHLAGLDGKLLEDIKTRIAAVAKKERSRTAPAHRLATIVAPMTDVPSADPSPNGKPRPNTTAPTVTGVEFTRTSGSSLRQRMALWREVQRENEGSEASASPRSPPKPRNVESAPAAAMSDSSPVLRPPAVRKGLVFA